jgi:glycosyltransferase involved in cell wall biosynthesis
MSPYHDVRMPANKRSVITVHDLCIGELASAYPRHLRAYYLSTMRRNLKYAAFILTVSETSCRAISAQYGIEPDRIGVVYNAPPDTFSGDVEEQAVTGFKTRFGLSGQLLLYPGGSEYRKNVHRLAQAFELLARVNNRLSLVVTGEKDKRWDAALSGLPSAARQCINFLGRLDDTDLRLAYAAADAVVYPSLCEGFGRVCLEAMASGRPLACSDLPVMHEVAGDYATYFDPYSIHEMAAAMETALKQGCPTPRRPEEYGSASVCERFVASMDKQLEAAARFDA